MTIETVDTPTMSTEDDDDTRLLLEPGDTIITLHAQLDDGLFAVVTTESFGDSEATEERDLDRLSLKARVMLLTRSPMPTNTMTKGEYDAWVEAHGRAPTWPPTGKRRTHMELANEQSVAA